ncbi:MAG: HAMP domain-containing sensor histidine kinase, partial [Rubrivivax sp.]|nr:HAMP domain-containing sensor histidine kinase [Rubrivivax sp.]
MLLITALTCLAIRWRDREPGMGWFALSMATLAVWVVFNRLHLPSGPQLDPSPWFYVMCLAMAAMGPGLVAYLDVPRPLRHWALGLVVAPSLAFAGAVALVDLTGVTILRVWVHLLTAVSFATMGALAWWAARREPGAGHGWLAAALLTVPLLAVVLVVTRADPVAMRYWAVLPAMLVGLSLPSVSLLRRRRAQEAEMKRRLAAEQALTALNATLEDSVSQRTADLQGIVAGLQSFNRSVSHDLRGPLGGIAGLARMAEEALNNGDDSVARRALPAIVTQADDSARLVSTLLELARVGDAELRPQRVDPRRIAQEVVDQLRLTASGRWPEFVLPSLPAVRADPELLRAVWANLIGNAVKFSALRDDARVEITGEAHSGAVRLQVCDNGVGFDAARA